MEKCFVILLSLGVLAIFATGCAELSKEAKVRCPKCGTVFKIHEGPYYGGDRP